jgi:hypothetical protein
LRIIKLKSKKVKVNLSKNFDDLDFSGIRSR